MVETVRGESREWRSEIGEIRDDRLRLNLGSPIFDRWIWKNN
jgi:hypothetical protein